MKVERVLAGDVMRHHGLMHMHRSFGLSRGAGGEMNQAPCPPERSAANVEIFRSAVHQLMKICVFRTAARPPGLPMTSTCFRAGSKARRLLILRRS